ncbi:MAG: YceI family protein [Anaerolineae bacterium]|nr:YceI family protein [Anaerolineae bacterium]
MIHSKSRIALVILPLFILLSACSSQTDPAPTQADAPAPSEELAPADSDSESPSTANQSMRAFPIVPGESQASYAVDEEFLAGALGPLGIEAGNVITIGSTQTIQGQLSIDLSQTPPVLGENSFTVDLSTLTSDQSRRDQRIRDKSLESSKFPLAVFVAQSIQDFPESYSEGEVVTFKLSGQLTIREITQPVTFEVQATLQGNTLSGTLTTKILMTDFGFEPPSIFNILTVGNEVTITVDFTAREN